MHNNQIKLKISWILLSILLLIAVATLFAVFILSVWFAVKLLIISFIMIYFYCLIKKLVLLQGENAIVTFWQKQTGDWCLQTRSGRIIDVRLEGSQLVSYSLLILNFIQISHKARNIFGLKRYFSLVLFRDAAAAADLRMLRLKLLDKASEE